MWGFFIIVTYLYDMTRISNHKNKILIAMEPRMRRILEKLKREENEDYFHMTQKDKDAVSRQIATVVINTTIEILNGYNREELPEILDLSITNLSSLEQHFVDMEMYAQAEMMKDAIFKLHDDLSKISTTKL